MFISFYNCSDHSSDFDCFGVAIFKSPGKVEFLFFGGKFFHFSEVNNAIILRVLGITVTSSLCEEVLFVDIENLSWKWRPCLMCLVKIRLALTAFIVFTKRTTKIHRKRTHSYFSASHISSYVGTFIA